MVWCEGPLHHHHGESGITAEFVNRSTGLGAFSAGDGERRSSLRSACACAGGGAVRWALLVALLNRANRADSRELHGLHGLHGFRTGECQGVLVRMRVLE
jgi:hypothetical protein